VVFWATDHAAFHDGFGGDPIWRGLSHCVRGNAGGVSDSFCDGLPDAGIETAGLWTVDGDLPAGGCADCGGADAGFYDEVGIVGSVVGS